MRLLIQRSTLRNGARKHLTVFFPDRPVTGRPAGLFRVNKYMHSYLEFEKPVADIEGKIQELRAIAAEDGEAVNVDGEIERLNANPPRRSMTFIPSSPPGRRRLLPGIRTVLMRLTTWRVWSKTSRPSRATGNSPKTMPCWPDRPFSWPIGSRSRAGKGHDTDTRLKHNFGMVRPEGYRKAVRIMELAERFDIPLISFVDTSGAYPGRGAEERGQSEAIARSTDVGLGLGVPSIAVVIGEGGSGGAIAIATANKVLMMEHAIYSVISPEGAASILWRDSAKAQDAATALKITAQDLKQLGVIDDIIVEPVGGAHRAREIVIDSAGKSIEAALEELSGLTSEEIRKQRRDKFIAIGRTLT